MLLQVTKCLDLADWVSMLRLQLRILCTTCIGAALVATARAETLVVPVGVPLRVELGSRTKITRVGQTITGRLTAPIYVRDRVVLPEGTEVNGVITALKSDSRSHRFGYYSRADFSPHHLTTIEFRQAKTSDGRVFDLQTADATPAGQLVRFKANAKRKPSLVQRAMDMAHERKSQFEDQAKAPGKMERLKTALVMSLPYHSQYMDKGTAFEAELRSPLQVEVAPQQVDLSQVGSKLAEVTVHARLLLELSSASSTNGEAVQALVTEPVFDNQHRLILPEGTALNGTVTRAKPAKWFARNGQLRFTFQSLALPGDTQQALHGTVAAAESDQASRIAIDEEGNAKAQSAPNKVLAPLTLALLATSGLRDDDGSGSGQSFLAGGFAWTGRLVVLAARSTPISGGFAYYALSHSVYSRWIARGHNVNFPKDTRVEIQFGER
jgi:hypothetical protein